MTDLSALAHESLLAYSCVQNENYDIPRHIETIAKVLQQVERGELKRVIITIPPRHGKSLLCSQNFPAWYLGRNPEKYIITATYGQELSDDFGRRVRDQIESTEFKAIFPTRLRKDSRAASRFETEDGGTYFSVGVGGPITGRGASLLLIDDPIKNREEADSVAQLQKTIDWYNAVAYTRLEPDAAVVIIMTRWAENDLVGHLITENAHEGWTKIDLPALNEETGEALWPQRYSAEDLKRIRSTILEYDWHCLYQQNPIPKEGIIFKPEWMPSGLKQPSEYAARFIAMDCAISQKQQADETAISVVGIPYGADPTIDEISTLHGRWDFEQQINTAKGLYAMHKPIAMGIEADRGGKIVAEVLRREKIPCIELPIVSDKVTRAMTVSHLFSQGRIRINTPELRSQLLLFRGGTEANDLADAFIHTLRLVMQCSSMRYAEKKDLHPWKHPENFKSYDDKVHAWVKKRQHISEQSYKRKMRGAPWI